MTTTDETDRRSAPLALEVSFEQVEPDLPTLSELASVLGVLAGAVTIAEETTWLREPRFPIRYTDAPGQFISGRVAELVHVRKLAFGSPLAIVLHLPEAVAASPVAIGFLLYTIKRLYGYPLELRTYHEEQRARLLRAQEICNVLESRSKPTRTSPDDPAKALAELAPGAADALRPGTFQEVETKIARLREAQPANWEMRDGSLAEAQD
jgi:hypothetical protein